ncbi:hypothetical protein HPG69_011751 [Diceros bicornis minor]|uniref:Gasdermin pore forming domain-containing protein n=1 Tax=Diceros bicornis minor TaxID=77932 RepID=A0A7J7EIP1_DICBM|nr:hypothetical protein HPG69_011751 [Diceros bicornis minor]
MPSMFERTSKNMVKEIGDKEPRPVKDFLSATKMHQFSLFLKKKTRSKFWEQPEVLADISLMHILEPSSSVPETTVAGPFLFHDTLVQKQKAGVSVNAGVRVSLLGEATESSEDSLQYQIVTMPFQTWTDLQQRKALDPEPPFLKQCWKAGVNLYVVTETVELLNSPVLCDTSSVILSGKFSIPWNTLVKLWDGNTKSIVSLALLPIGVWILISICFQMSEGLGSLFLTSHVPVNLDS